MRATTVGSVGYSISPSSAESAQAAGVAGQAVGLKRGYIPVCGTVLAGKTVSP